MESDWYQYGSLEAQGRVTLRSVDRLLAARLIIDPQRPHETNLGTLSLHDLVNTCKIDKDIYLGMRTSGEPHARRGTYLSSKPENGRFVVDSYTRRVNYDGDVLKASGVYVCLTPTFGTDFFSTRDGKSQMYRGAMLSADLTNPIDNTYAASIHLELGEEE